MPQGKEKAVHPAIKPFYKVERQLERVLEWLQKLALLEILGIIGNVGIIIAVLTYIGTEKQRRDTEVLNAWQTITNASGQAGSGGRIQALEFLNASPGANWRRKFPWVCAPMPICTWPAESLAGINLAVDVPEKVTKENNNDFTDGDKVEATSTRAYLVKIQLSNAELRYANLKGADLGYANLKDAELDYANLRGAYLWYANLESADLRSADLQDTEVIFANLKDAFLGSANLEGASLAFADLEDADLGSANLKDTELRKANFKGADLQKANLEGADLAYANLEGAKGLGVEQITRAKLCSTTLPIAVDLPADRDCAELGYNPESDMDIKNLDR